MDNTTKFVTAENSDPAAFLYLDTETTGLGLEDQVTEVAWCSPNKAAEAYFLPHTRLPNVWIINNTDYLTRIFPATKSKLSYVAQALRVYCERLKCLAGASTVHLVGACPAFDDRMLRRSLFDPLGEEPPWSHRLIDIETAVAYHFGFSTPRSLRDTRVLLGLAGENSAPHTAGADAYEVLELHQALLVLQKTSELQMPIAKHNEWYSTLWEHLRSREFSPADANRLIGSILARTREGGKTR